MTAISQKATDYVPASLWGDLSRAEARLRGDTIMYHSVRVEGTLKDRTRKFLAESTAALEAARVAIIEAAGLSVVTVALDLKRTIEVSAAEESAAAKSMAQQSAYVKLLDGLYPEEQA